MPRRRRLGVLVFSLPMIRTGPPMYVNVAILRETRTHERRVAMVPSVVPKLIKLGAKLHLEAGAGLAVKLADAAFADVAIVSDRIAMVAAADVVLAVQPPALAVIDAMKPGAILICFVYAANEPAVVEHLIARKITCFAMERIPRISRAQSMDALSSQSALAGYYAVALGMTHMTSVLPKDHISCGGYRAGKGVGDGPRCGGPRGDCDRPASRRGG